MSLICEATVQSDSGDRNGGGLEKIFRLCDSLLQEPRIRRNSDRVCERMSKIADRNSTLRRNIGNCDSGCQPLAHQVFSQVLLPGSEQPSAPRTVDRCAGRRFSTDRPFTHHSTFTRDKFTTRAHVRSAIRAPPNYAEAVPQGAAGIGALPHRRPPQHQGLTANHMPPAEETALSFPKRLTPGAEAMRPSTPKNILAGQRLTGRSTSVEAQLIVTPQFAPPNRQFRPSVAREGGLLPQRPRQD